MELDRKGLEAALQCYRESGLRYATARPVHAEAFARAVTAYLTVSPDTGYARGLARAERKYPFGRTIAEMDTEAFLNVRQWVWNALEKAGAEREGAGIGLGMATLCIVIEGMRYDLTITPLETPPRALSPTLPPEETDKK